MKVIKIKIADLKKPEKNIRIHTQTQLKDYVRSVKMFGQLRPIVVDETNTILAGNGLADALLAAGYTEADCYKITDLTPNQKKKLMIADNRIFSLGVDNLETLNAFISDLAEDLDIPGYDEEILKQMVSDAEEVTEKLEEYGTLQPDEIESIKKNAERKEAQAIPNLNQTPDSTNNSVGGDEVVVRMGEVVESEPNIEEKTEIGKFVICPHCGGKIWL